MQLLYALNGRDMNGGLLDAAKGSPVVYVNGHSFGGDATKMTLFGQFAGK